MNDHLNVLRHYYHAFKAGIREQLKPRNIHVRLPGGSQFNIARADEIAERISHGTYEVDVLRFIRRVLKPGMVALDLGAHCGYFTLLMREAVGPGGQVHSFEPSPCTYRRLLGNIRRNHFTNVFACETALGLREGWITFNAYKGVRAAYSTLGTPPFPHSVRTEVPVTTLDLYTSRQSVGHIDLAKMDVEGSELEVLQGARRLLESRAVKVLVFEVSDIRLESRATSSAALLDYLMQLDYTLHDLNNEGRLTPISQQVTYGYQNLVATAPGLQLDALTA